MTPLERLTAVPRLDLRGFTSPVQPLERLSEQVGAEIWCKHDDIGSVGLAGNKVRKLEVELAHAVEDGAEHLVVEGSRLSNATRAVAAAAATIGLRCTLVLCHDEPRTPVGNLMLDGLFGADLRFVGDLGWADLAREASAVVDELRASGERVHRLPIGCASERSCLGFALAFVELQQQMAEQGRTVGSIVHASSSGGTHAGLTLGRRLTGADTEVLGVVVAPDVYDDVPEQYLSFARGGAALLGRISASPGTTSPSPTPTSARATDSRRRGRWRRSTSSRGPRGSSSTRSTAPRLLRPSSTGAGVPGGTG